MSWIFPPFFPPCPGVDRIARQRNSTDSTSRPIEHPSGGGLGDRGVADDDLRLRLPHRSGDLLDRRGEKTGDVVELLE